MCEGGGEGLGKCVHMCMSIRVSAHVHMYIIIFCKHTPCRYKCPVSEMD